MTNNRLVAQSTARTVQRAAMLVAIYVVLIFLLPANHADLREHHLSLLQYRTILFAVSLPSLLTWLVAFAGYAKLREYVYLIRKSPEGAYFSKLAVGCAWLAWSLPLSAILAFLLDGLANSWTGFYSSAVIISNYSYMLLSLIALSIIGNASRGLVNRARLKFSLASVRIIMLLFLTAGVLYCYLTFRHFDLSSLSSTHNPYYLPIWLMVISIIIPYLYAWFTGLLAAYEIHLFSRRTNGVLYRQALRLLVAGLITIILSSVAVQYVSSLQPHVGQLTLGYQLVLVSVFRLIGGGGFLLLGLGAIRLKKIEEI